DEQHAAVVRDRGPCHIATSEIDRVRQFPRARVPDAKFVVDRHSGDDAVAPGERGHDQWRWCLESGFRRLLRADGRADHHNHERDWPHARSSTTSKLTEAVTFPALGVSATG